MSFVQWFETWQESLGPIKQISSAILNCNLWVVTNHDAYLNEDDLDEFKGWVKINLNVFVHWVKTLDLMKQISADTLSCAIFKLQCANSWEMI